MHAIFFGLKRAFHGSLRVARHPLATLGLTAARFDMLYALEENRSSLAQSALRRTLGVSAPTVSRMLRSLEDLGLVERRLARDRRQKLVSLTRLGLACIRYAITRMIGTGAISLVVESALADQWWNESACIAALGDFESPLDRVRRAYGDIATLVYPWHPDD